MATPLANEGDAAASGPQWQSISVGGAAALPPPAWGGPQQPNASSSLPQPSPAAAAWGAVAPKLAAAEYLDSSADKYPPPAGQPSAPAPAPLPPLCGVPVLFDFAHQQTRSVVLTCAIVLVLGMDIIVNITLPELFGGRSAWSCYKMYSEVTRQQDASFTGTGMVTWLLYIPFVVLSLIAASPYANPLYVPIALGTAILYFAMTTASDAQYCFRAPPLDTSHQIMLQLMYGQSTALTMLLHIILWLACIAVLVELVRLTVQYVVKRHQGALRDMCVFAPNVAAQRASQNPPFDDLFVFWFKVPLRLSFTTVLTLVTLVGIITYVHTLVGGAARVLPSLLAHTAPVQGVDMLALLLAASNAVLTALWLSFIIILGLMVFSFVAVAAQHAALVHEHVTREAPVGTETAASTPSVAAHAEIAPSSASVIASGNPTDSTSPPAPVDPQMCVNQPAFLTHSTTLNLDAFDYSTVVSYTGTHVLVHLFVFLSLFVLLACIMLAIVVLAWFSPASLAVYIIGAIRSIVYTLLQRSSHLMPTSGTCGWVRYLACTRDRRISRPRWLLLADSIVSFTIGFVWALSNAVNRLLLSVVWAILRVALLHEPVLPRPLAMWDVSFASHGAMMKMRFLAVLDPLADAQHV